MYKPDEIFRLIQNSEYKTVGEDVQYCIKVIDDTIYLLFQETRSKQDWKINFDFLCRCYKKQEHKMYGHRGFIKAYKSANDKIMEDLSDIYKLYLRCSNKLNIVVCGWSLGGAYAQLACEDINYRSSIKPILITFGAPKVLLIGRKWIKRSCDIPSSRQYANVNDIVPLLPPFYFSVLRSKVDKFNIKKLWKWPCHCEYGNKDFYNEFYNNCNKMFQKSSKIAKNKEI